MPDNCFANVTVDAANVRVQPVANAAIAAIARRGDRLPVREISAPDSQNMRWVRVSVPANNTTGWVRGDLVQLSGDCAELGATGGSSGGTSPNPSPTPPTPTPSDPIVLPGDCQGEVITASATVRSGPSLTNSIRGFINRGTKFLIVDISEADSQGFRWYEFEFNLAPGWVREDLVRETGDCLDLHTHNEPTPTPVPTPTPTPTPVPTPTPTPGPTDGSACVAVIGLSQVSVRAQPNTGSQRLGTGSLNEQFAVKGITPAQSDGFTWTQIDFRGQNGFIRSDLVSLQGNCATFINDDRLPRPVSGQITQGFRPAFNPTHSGIDIGTSPKEVRTTISGVVERAMTCVNCAGTPPNIMTNDPAVVRQIFSDANWGFGYGNHVILRYKFSDIPRSAQEKLLREGATSQSNVYVLFAHFSELKVLVGQNLAANTVLGKTGNTGYSSAEHLHLEVAFGSRWDGAKKVHPSCLFIVENV